MWSLQLKKKTNELKPLFGRVKKREGPKFKLPMVHAVCVAFCLGLMEDVQDRDESEENMGEMTTSS